ncbi:patatin-like phospholipase family protein [Caenispirillum salinarum]|uniref:patatin-like phospholipase family protein n=1 Tax=Caenispirillum salinarum TaxID=859058 RepID=UPI00385172FA
MSSHQADGTANEPDIPPLGADTPGRRADAPADRRNPPPATGRRARFQSPGIRPCGGGRPVNLALQGGGAHGAFTWGVLDAFLADDRIVIESMSGTSAGAMNAAVVANGLAGSGDREAARAGLERFWRAVAHTSRLSPFKRGPLGWLTGSWGLDANPFFLGADLMQRLFSPYELNPINHNPLQSIVEEQVDFDRVRRCDRVQVFVTATSVRSGRPRVFRHDELTADHIMASACLPFLYQAVEIGDEAYWDGGYMGNPALWPFIYRGGSRDIVLVQINPLERTDVPKRARDIINRLNEITFNASLYREMRAIAFVSRLLEEGRLPPEDYRKMFIHMVSGGDEMAALSASSKFNTEWEFLTWLRDLGRARAQAWLDENAGALGERSTVDVERTFLGAGEHDSQPPWLNPASDPSPPSPRDAE